MVWWRRKRRKRPDNNDPSGTEGRRGPQKPLPPYPTGGDRGDAKFPRRKYTPRPMTSDEINRREDRDITKPVVFPATFRSHAESKALVTICPACRAKVLVDPLTGQMVIHRKGHNLKGPFCDG